MKLNERTLEQSQKVVLLDEFKHERYTMPLSA